ncbi:hypothetical protein N7494_011690 [Penicillium frequentans]|uniref:Leucine-rich repeat domain-containing protein n=1 Tax=Penicillium frequentans TaxID=3151616 RepID=A0AAD6CKE1_9EURO|nr:hypothetical protein N7494_011690 [Penicillium glabrum]
MPILNNDVVLLIEDHLYYQPDKFSMMRVCRQWYALLLPRLFARRIWVSRENIYPLVRCIQKNPSIRTAIQNLVVRLDLELVSKEQGPEPKYDARIVRDAVERACDSRAEQTRWNRGLRMGDKDAWLAVLLQYLEGITVLDLGYSDKSDYFIPMLRRVVSQTSPLNTKPVFQKLEKVHVSTDEDIIHLVASDFLPLFRLPAMRVFNADGLYEEYEENSLKPSPGTSGIREMNLGRVGLGSNGVRGMADYITACGNLEIFEYQHNSRTPSRHFSLSFHSGAFYTALATQKNSLRVLRLNDSGQSLARGCDDEFDNEEFNQFGSLVEFHHLRELRISVRTILQFGHGHHPTVSLSAVLPSSLECLYLSHYWEEDFDVVVANLTSVATQRAERFSNLIQVRIQSSHMERFPRSEGGWKLELPESIHRIFAPLAEMFLEAGIDFGLCKPGWAAGRIA